MEWVLIGRRRNDFGFMVDFHKTRAILRANTVWIKGVPLESIEPGRNKLYPGLVLIHRKWKQLYFVRERKNWADEQYFNHAKKRIKELGLESGPGPGPGPSPESPKKDI